MTEFLSCIDRAQSEVGCPALRAASHYHEVMLRMWMEREKAMDINVFNLSFKEGTALEQFRQMAVNSVFHYAVDHKLHEKTVHLTCLNINRLLYNRLVDHEPSSRDARVLTHDLFACIVITSLRNAIKNDESFEKSELFRIDPDHVWRSTKYLVQVVQDRSVARINQIEAECLSVLDVPSNPPLAPEFIDRYLGVGGWPEYTQQYRELSSYLVGLAVFANTYSTPLRGVPNSKLAAAALVLAIKVINTDFNNTKYEFWPQRLAHYTRLTMDDLKPVIRGLANLLRNKPRWSSILESYYGKWSEYDWN
ncbi:carboxy-terminal domain cyclin [Gregarina niphandrodes]|uniref:Carboxy-terminal domain cyclin n=1 Tax=Gregarina niphandrodes TaxID=110365 RepID=A0A023BA54_GRENI|nr:carboxy-terminal domain cyclin [Gregarina niphandrodes]EZG77891.1 carboxy-terminal domain cyclin [Gregarina niphandrodes]|eukprot:XP_011129468.1 carboxy-terminal domain cyclin [Gregarina niphandrodes]